ncbi:hypothetical protein BGX28_000713 [Mortierella sp. GBA30]|nr:hypothetical protein BGX28_000713 [Mortierella sp. GBA30]
MAIITPQHLSQNTLPKTCTPSPLILRWLSQLALHPCYQSASAPLSQYQQQHRWKRLPVPAGPVFRGEDLSVDEIAVGLGAEALVPDHERSWNQLSARLKLDWESRQRSHENKNTEISISEVSSFAKDTKNQIGIDSSDVEGLGCTQTNLGANDDMGGGYSLAGLDTGSEDGIVKDVMNTESVLDNETIQRGNAGATPQEAYVDIWSETSDTLSEDDYQELEEDYLAMSKAEETKQQYLVSRLDADTKYMTYLPYAGLTNQFYGMLRAIMLAKSLDRTLILPPITASSHDKSKQNQPWSSYFDLDTFMRLTGVKVVEFHNVREPDRIAAAESLKCHVTCGFGSLRPLDFSAKEFLKQWKFDLSMTPLEIEASKFNELVPALRSVENEQMLCITNGYKIAVPKKEEWDLYGRYFYFTPTIERFFGGVLQRLKAAGSHAQINLPSEHMQQTPQEQQQTEEISYGDRIIDTHEDKAHKLINSDIPPNSGLLDESRLKGTSDNVNSENPLHGPFISIHVRRGDFIDYCHQHFQHALQTCLPTTQELASTLHELLVADPSLRGLPIYVSTNEDRPEELAQFRYLGWHVLDHQKMGSREFLGVFGAMMMDQIFMAQAQVLIGVQTSAFSRVGAYRQEDWYGRKAVFV